MREERLFLDQISGAMEKKNKKKMNE